MKLSYGHIKLVEALGKKVAQHTSNLDGALVTRDFLGQRWPSLPAALDDSSGIFVPGAREKALAKMTLKALFDARAAAGLGEAAKLASPALLNDLAQFAAGLTLIAQRRPEVCDLVAAGSAAAEPDTEPQSALMDLERPPPNCDNLHAVLNTVAESIPVVRLGLPYATFESSLHLRQFPSFFTSGIESKEYQVSLRACVDEFLQSWLKDAGSSAALLSGEVLGVGVACALDIKDDDKACVGLVLVGARKT